MTMIYRFKNKLFRSGWFCKIGCFLKLWDHKFTDYPKYTVMFDPPEQAWMCERCGLEMDDIPW